MIPIASEVTTLLQKIVKADKVVLFLHNKEIDMLYSLALVEGDNAQFGQFTVNSIRMRSNLGLAGKAFTSSQVVNDFDDKQLV